MGIDVSRLATISADLERLKLYRLPKPKTKHPVPTCCSSSPCSTCTTKRQESENLVATTAICAYPECNRMCSATNDDSHSRKQPATGWLGHRPWGPETFYGWHWCHPLQGQSTVTVCSFFYAVWIIFPNFSVLKTIWNHVHCSSLFLATHWTR